MVEQEQRGISVLFECQQGTIGTVGVADLSPGITDRHALGHGLKDRSKLAGSSLSFLCSLAQGVSLCLQLAVRLLDTTARLHLFGHLHTMNQNPLDVSLRRAQWLTD